MSPGTVIFPGSQNSLHVTNQQYVAAGTDELHTVLNIETVRQPRDKKYFPTTQIQSSSFSFFLWSSYVTLLTKHVIPNSCQEGKHEKSRFTSGSCLCHRQG